MQLTGVFLWTQLERAYIRQVRDDLHQSGQLLVGQLSTYTLNGKMDAAAIAGYVLRWPYSVLVLDANGLVIGATMGDIALRDKKFAHDDISPALVGQETTRLGSESGVRMAYEALPIFSANQIVGVVYLKASLKEVDDRLGDIRDVLLTALVLALASTALLGLGLSSTITGPVRELTRKAAEMAGGNFDQSIEVRSQDEIGRLGEMFNRMTQRLKLTLDEARDEKNKVEAILSHMADGLMALDSAGLIIKLNPAAERMFHTTEAEVLGRHPDEVWPDTRLDVILAEARDEGVSVSQEIRVGHLILATHVTPLRGERHQPAGTVVVFHDITELEKLENMRREFVANVSHELRTPLTTVKSYVETLLDGAADDPEVRGRFLRVLESETERMARLVKDLLHLSQLDQGSGTWDIHSQEVGPLVEECVGRLSVPAERKTLTIRPTVSPDTPLGWFDRDKLQQVVLNLLANAIEFTPPAGEITVTVKPAGPMIAVSIRDSGIGIPAEDLPRIFERFYRVDKARSRTLGGTGLGLAIARQIVELHGGSITLTSQLGKGTEVVFTVPAAAASETRWQ